MDRFRELMSVVLLSGVVAGLLLFIVQHFTTFPLIQRAEIYESAAERPATHAHHDEQAWHPADGIERTLFTAVTTVLTAVGFSALLFGIAALTPAALDWRKGACWGIAAFLCIDLAPAFGLAPQPPGTAVADLYSRQLWWVATAISTAIGLWLLTKRGRSLALRLAGVLVIILPHAVGAPVAAGENAVPAELMHRFALASILTTGMFWVALGSIGGLLYRRWHLREAH